MILNELFLTNFRTYDTAKYMFKPGINLIAGVNGAGKSTALDAIRILMSRALRQKYGPVQAIEETDDFDIRRTASAYDISVKFSVQSGSTFEFLGHLDRHPIVTGLEGYGRTAAQTSLAWRKRMRRLGQDPDRSSIVERPETFRYIGQSPSQQVDCGFVLYFSPHRSLLTSEVTSTSATTSALPQSLADRRLNLRQVAEWWLAQRALVPEGGKYIRRAEALERAMFDFLRPTIQSVRPRPRHGRVPATLTAVKDLRRFDIFELSDGERGVLALVFEIARRLAIAYPDFDDPTRDGAACILIDEIELHLHPQWQRDVLRWLERTFPKCQFIATTHSPQIIGEVAHDRVYMIGKEPLDQTLGMDSGWILRNVMDTPDRSEKSRSELRLVEQAIKDKKLEEALRLVEEIENQFGVFDQLQSLRTKAELMLRLRKP